MIFSGNKLIKPSPISCRLRKHLILHISCIHQRFHVRLSTSRAKLCGSLCAWHGSFVPKAMEIPGSYRMNMALSFYRKEKNRWVGFSHGSKPRYSSEHLKIFKHIQKSLNLQNHQVFLFHPKKVPEVGFDPQPFWVNKPNPGRLLLCGGHRRGGRLLIFLRFLPDLLLRRVFLRDFSPEQILSKELQAEPCRSTKVLSKPPSPASPDFPPNLDAPGLPGHPTAPPSNCTPIRPEPLGRSSFAPAPGWKEPPTMTHLLVCEDSSTVVL